MDYLARRVGATLLEVHVELKFESIRSDTPLSSLILETDSESRSILRKLQSLNGFEVTAVPTLAEALECFANQHVDLLSVDDDLPDDGAIALIADLRRHGWGGAIVVTVTRTDHPADASRVDGLGVERIFWKPFHGSEYDSELREIGGRLRRARAALSAEPLSGALRLLAVEYAARLPDEIDALRRELDRVRSGEPGVIDEVIRRVHSMCGTSGTYRFNDLSLRAGQLERTLRAAVEAGDVEGVWGRVTEIFDALRLALPDLENVAAGKKDEAGPTLLLADPDLEELDEINRLGAERRIRILAAHSVEGAVALARQCRLDGVLLDQSIDGHGGLDLLRTLRRLPGKSALPVAFLRKRPIPGGHAVPAAAHSGLSESGAAFLVDKPIDAGVFATTVDRLLQPRRRREPRLLVLDDDGDFANAVRAMLVPHGIQVTWLRSAPHILDVLAEHEPDMVLVDVFMPIMNGFEACRMIRASRQWTDLPVIFVTSMTSPQVRLECYRAGGDEYLPKPIVEEELIARVTSRLDRSMVSHDYDELTGLLRRTALLAGIERQVEIAGQEPYAAAVLSVDRFKRVNGLHGIEAGDRVLAVIGDALASQLPRNWLVGRWSGDEFVIVAPRETRKSLTVNLQRLVERLARIPFRSERGRTFEVSFNLGIAAFPRDGQSFEHVLYAADARAFDDRKGRRA